MTQYANLYGKSLYDLAAEEQAEERIAEEMECVSQLLNDNPDYVRLLSEASLPKAERLHLLDEAFGDAVHPYLLNFMKILVEEDHVREFTGCCRRVRHLYNADHGITEAEAVSAVPLTDAQREALVAKLQKVSGKTVRLTCREDPSILGGLRVTMDGKLYDGTVQGRLGELRQKVTGTTI